MTVLITGVTGLVGARLLPRLVEAGVECRALVRGGKEVPARVSPVNGDLFDPPSLAKAVEGSSAIIHLAAVFRTPDTDLIWKSNLEGTRNLIAAAKTHVPEARFILASTSNVYDMDSEHPGREDDAVAPQHPYPASKVAAEKELAASGINWAVLRFPFVYGDQDGHLEEMPKHAIAGNWHPAKRMSTIHHHDIATAIHLALDGAFDRRIINICDEAPTSIFELTHLVGERIESSAEPLENPWHLHVDGSLARSLGFVPGIRTVHQAVREDLL
ncbi:NAD-dependent epimerase/dehydratase family protein [Aurantiacibacter flavus]|uniref:NAD(P)-dependent oxidoreductase n=1 Tax=Aurantiacibacter flavus TaxID=3145232 RepID=A0ABV0CZS1_9SPHN